MRSELFYKGTSLKEVSDKYFTLRTKGPTIAFYVEGMKWSAANDETQLVRADQHGIAVELIVHPLKSRASIENRLILVRTEVKAQPPKHLSSLIVGYKLIENPENPFGAIEKSSAKNIEGYAFELQEGRGGIYCEDSSRLGERANSNDWMPSRFRNLLTAMRPISKFPDKGCCLEFEALRVGDKISALFMACCGEDLGEDEVVTEIGKALEMASSTLWDKPAKQDKTGKTKKS